MSPGLNRQVRLSWIDRLILVFAGLVLFALAIWMWTGAFNWWPAGGASLFFRHIGLGSFVLIVGGCAFALAGLHIVFIVVSEHANKFVSFRNELGQVTVSVKAIIGVVQRAVQGIDGIKDANVTIIPGDSGIDISVSLAVLPGPTVQNVTDRVSRSVAAIVRETVGVHVNDVTVEISSIAEEVVESPSE